MVSLLMNAKNLTIKTFKSVVFEHKLNIIFVNDCFQFSGNWSEESKHI